jgi:ABC-2 type transport system ATP-binding protein
MIEVDRLHKSFGIVDAVNGISFSVGKGEVVGFLGPNGAGKSTTMKMITGYLPPTSGGIRICGFDVERDATASKKHIGYLPEGAPLYSEMTPAALLEFWASVRGLSGERRRERIRFVVGALELEPVLLRRIETLSKGYRRRVGFAQAMLHDPDVLILDEPTDGLDPNQKRQVRKLIRDMSASKAIIISTHLLEEVDAVCDRALVIDQGRIVLEGTPADLHAHSPWHNAVVVTVPPERMGRARDTLRALKGAERVEDRPETTGAPALWVIGKGRAALTSEVSIALAEAGVSVLSMRTEEGRLDEVFRSVTGAGQV